MGGRLDGKVALVTGGGTGIGRATSIALAAEGAAVAVNFSRSRGDAEETASEITSIGRRAITVGCDVSDDRAVEDMVGRVARDLGGLDILVNNAAVTTRSNLETTDAEAFDRIIAVNLRAPLLLIRAALPHFRRAGGGRVLNIGSINGYCGEANLLAYSISKGGLMTLSRNLADAYGREGLIVNHFNVGWTLTPNEYALKMREGLPADWPTRLPKTTAPSGALLSPQQIAHFALMFLCDEAGPVNGAVVDLEQYPIIGRNPIKETV
jgi:NAD(P)-dependent dehydrogenase (short-subunit alcohol dehydrogenase family)